jgi:WD40 repeat protein
MTHYFIMISVCSHYIYDLLRSSSQFKVRVWKLKELMDKPSREPTLELMEHENDVNDLDYHPDYLATLSSEKCCVRSIESGEVKYTIDHSTVQRGTKTTFRFCRSVVFHLSIHK